jgi:hypothetical protein
MPVSVQLIKFPSGILPFFIYFIAPAIEIADVG